MQAIMLAAGKGSRLGKYTNDNTKCMLEINGETLLERTIKSLKLANINKLILVLGYKKENVIKYIHEKNLDKEIEISYVFNDDYDTTNNIYSLYLAIREFEADDTILLESDVIFDLDLIKKIVQNQEQNLAIVSKYKEWMDGTVVKLDNDRHITSFIDGKSYNYNEIDLYYKTVNIYKFTKEYIKQYYTPFLKAYVQSYGKNCYYELVLKVIASIQNSKIKALPLENVNWYEIDDCQDLEIAKNIFSTGEEKITGLQKRYGGYWRFDSLKDFCYLVNPYFPTTEMKNKMKYKFDELLCNYPSTLNVQNNAISRFFSVDEKKLIVGNGATELINNLGHVIKGKVGLHIPSFNEYVRCFPDNEIVKINSINNDFKYNTPEIKQMVDKVDSLVIINPDNPSGSFIEYKDMIEIIELYNENKKHIIIDESFVDFSDEKVRYSLTNDEILDKYKYLTAIKSISKSYGVPGLRLGALATSNEDTLSKIKSYMPIWNINSFAEYFLQIFIPYQKQYIEACNKIEQERKRFVSDLQEISDIKVYPSQANYLLIKLLNCKAKALTLNMMEKYNILIKDLSSKEGFDNREFIRTAIKDENDNKLFVRALKETLK